MIQLNVGSNFDFGLIESIKALNKKYKKNNIQVSELYGSLPRSVFNTPSARPDFRIAEISMEVFAEFVKKCHEAGLKFNYTLNSPLTSDWFKKNKNFYDIFLDYMKTAEVDIVTIAHSLPMNYLFGKITIEVSTIMEVDNINAIQYYLDYLEVHKICLSIAKNRDFKFLKLLSKTKYVQNIELLANEFCSFYGIPCQNFLRKACYQMHALGGNQNNKHKGFPMLWCSFTREASPVSWLKANAIYPHDLYYYTDLGFNKFKLSGRTLPTEFILKTVEAYLSFGEVQDDNLLRLWGDVKFTHTNDKMQMSETKISLKKLKNIDFLKHFYNSKDSCASKLCSKCVYCHKIYTRLFT